MAELPAAPPLEVHALPAIGGSPSPFAIDLERMRARWWPGGPG